MNSGEPKPSSPFDDFATAGQRGPQKFFFGAELSRLLVLVVIAVVGWVLVWKFVALRQEPAQEAEPLPVPSLPPVKPDPAPAFESVTDKTPIGLRDMAAYDMLLKRARQASAAELAGQSHRDVYFTDLWERPERYRGAAIHVLGTARRIISYESKRSSQGRLYEAWISTHESQGYPYVCIFEDVPKGLPIGPELSERVVFNGYFLKQMRYLSGRDVQRAAPVLIGRIGWTPVRSAARRDNSVFWILLIVGGMFAISLFRWIAGLHRALSRRSCAAAGSSFLLDRPTEDIAPAELAHWVESVRENEGEHQPEEDH